MSDLNYAMLFPGQGSQAVGMLSSHHDALIAATFDEASQALGWDLAALVRSEEHTSELQSLMRISYAVFCLKKKKKKKNENYKRKKHEIHSYTTHNIHLQNKQTKYIT